MLRRRIRRQVVRAFGNISVWQCLALTEGLVMLVGCHRAALGLQAFGQGNRGHKKYLHLRDAVDDCCQLWSRATGRDWRKVNTRGIPRDREKILSKHPPIVLTGILITAATGKSRVSSLDYVFRDVVRRGIAATKAYSPRISSR